MKTFFQNSAIWAVLMLLCLASCQPDAPASSTAVPERIVSLLPSATELIYEVGQGHKLVGVTLNDDYPPEVKELPKVGDQNIDMERVVALKPDLVILDSEFNRDTQALERLGLRVLDLKCQRLDDVAKSLRLLGAELGCQEQAEARASEFEETLSAVEPLNLEGTVFVETWGNPLMTVGSQTLIDDLLRLLGAENCYQDQLNPFQVDPEDVLARQPSYILLPTGAEVSTESEAYKLCQRVGLEPKLVRIDADLLVRPGPRLLLGLEHLRQALKPRD